jgi:DNA-binding FadR family transcriptional regulator
MAKKDLTPIKLLKRRPLLYQTVQEEIKDYIVQNGLKPGDKLPPETELAKLFGVSRTSVREAVKSMETLGILQARAGAGLCVKSFSFDPLLDNLAYGLMFDQKDVFDMLEVRFHIEHGMAHRAIEKVTDEQLARLKKILEDMRLAAQEGMYVEKYDRMFHNALWSNLENALLGRIVDVFWLVIAQARRRSPIPNPANPMDAYKSHAAIFKALENRDVKAMQECMMKHYMNLQKRVRLIHDAPSEA